MKYESYIFDFDGTLVETGEGIIASLELMQRKMKLKQLDRKTLELFLGPSMKDSMMKYYGVSYEKTDKMTEVYRDCYLEVGMDKSVMYDGVIKMLRNIHQKHGKIAIASLKQYQVAVQIMEKNGIKEYLDYASLNWSNTLGDKAAQIKDCLVHLDSPKEKTIMVGDSINDSVAAQEVGVDFLALAYGDGFRKDKSLKDADYVYAAKSTKELASFIDQCLK